MIEQQYIELFKSNRSEIDANSSKGLNKHRDAAFETFSRLGFPTSKLEDYKNTDVSRMFDADFGLNINNLTIPVDPYEAFKCDIPNLNTNLYFLINDRYYDKERQENTLPKKVFIGSLRKFSEEHSKVFKKHYAKIADYTDNGVIAYNTMFAQDGFVIYVPENIVVEQPIQLINILRSDVDLNANRRILIIAEKNAQVKLLVCDHAVDDVNFAVTQVTEIYADRDAQVDFYELEENSVKTMKINKIFSDQQDKSHVNISSLTLHNGLTRNDFRSTLSGKHAEVHIGGLVINDKEQHTDNFV